MTVRAQAANAPGLLKRAALSANLYRLTPERPVGEFQPAGLA